VIEQARPADATGSSESDRFHQFISFQDRQMMADRHWAKVEPASQIVHGHFSLVPKLVKQFLTSQLDRFITVFHLMCMFESLL